MTSPRRRATRRAVPLFLALAIPAIAASPAAAGTATLANGQLKFTAAAGEYNNVDFSYDSWDDMIRVGDSYTIALGGGTGACVRDTVWDSEQNATVPDPTSLMCPVAGITSLAADLGDKDDALENSSEPFAGPRTINGGTGDDNVDDFNDFGPSTINGSDGFDSLSTYGNGNDTLNGGPGDDDLYSSEGASKLFGGLGNDSLRVGNGKEFVSTLEGDEGNDQLTSGVGNDVLLGEAGDDSLSGYEGTDTLNGGPDNDRLDGDYDKRPLSDTLIGGTGVDTVDYGGRTVSVGPVNVSLDGVANDGATGEADKLADDVENITGTWYDDVLTGNAQPNEIHSLMGDDIVTGGGGSDELQGSSGDDQITGAAGDDTILGDGGNDVLDGGDGNDDMFGGEGDDDAFGGDGADKIRTESDFDEVDGGPGLDNIDAGSGSDTLRSRDDLQDQVACSGGSDLAYIDGLDNTDGACAYVKVAPGASVDRAANRITFTAGPAGAASASTMAVTSNGTTLTFTNSAADVAVGSGCTRGANARTVNCPINVAGLGPVLAITIDGNDGADTITQGAAIQTRFVGGPGNDKIYDSPASDTMFGNDGDDRFTQSIRLSSDSVYGGDGKDAVSYGGDPANFGAWPARPGKVAVTLDSVRNDGDDPNGDGAAEEGDYIRGDVEDVTGGAAADYLKGSGIGNTLNGGGGADFLTGGLGKDTLNGGAGLDIINSRDGNPDTIACQTDGGRLTMDATGDVQTGCTIVP